MGLKHAAIIVAIALVTLVHTSPAAAQQYKVEELQRIVEIFCGSEAPLDGSTETMTGDVEGTIRLSRLARLLTEAGLTGEFSVEAKDYSGLTQEGLAIDRSDRRKCGLSLSEMLISQQGGLELGEGRVEVIAHRQEVRDQTSAEVCGINAFFEFHPQPGNSPRSLTLASPKTGRTVVSVGEMQSIAPDCHLELLEFRYFGGRDYSAIVQQVYF